MGRKGAMFYIEEWWDRFGGTISLAYVRETIWGSGVGLTLLASYVRVAPKK